MQKHTQEKERKQTERAGGESSRTSQTMVIIGAGQMGQAVAQLLNPNRIRLLAFGDNDAGKWTDPKAGPARKAEAGAAEGACDCREGTGAEEAGCQEDTGADAVGCSVRPDAACSVPVLPVEAALALQPDRVLLSVTGQDREAALTAQVRATGFNGPVLLLGQMREMFDIRSRCIHLAADRIREREIPGQIAELGVYQGDTAWQLNALFPDRKLYLFDTFEGFDARDTAREQADERTGRVSLHAQAGRFADTSAEVVLARMPHPDQVQVCQGYFPDSLQQLERTDGSGRAGDSAGELTFALVSLDPDLYAPTLAGLEYFYPRLAPGGMILVHDYNSLQFTGVKWAVRIFEEREMARTGQPLRIMPLGDLHGTCAILG